jgi:Phosphopantetheine attachment site
MLMQSRASAFGFDSQALIATSTKLCGAQGKLAAAFGVELTATVMFDYPTVDALAGHLAALAAQRAPSHVQVGLIDPRRGSARQDTSKRSWDSTPLTETWIGPQRL